MVLVSLVHNLLIWIYLDLSLLFLGVWNLFVMLILYVGKKMKLLLLELYCGFLMQDEGGNMILYHCQLGFFQLLDLLYLICQERIFDLLELMLLGNKFWYLIVLSNISGKIVILFVKIL